MIASDRCGGADIILHGANGYRFRSEDVDELHSCLTAFLCAEQTKMRMATGKNGSALTIPLVSDYWWLAWSTCAESDFAAGAALA